MHKPNNGRKFNPTDGTVPPLFPIASEQKVIVLFVEFANSPPGGPDNRLDPKYFDDMLFGTEYDPPEYNPPQYTDSHPTDRTLYNYYQEVSYGAVHITTQNLPSKTGWVNVGQRYEYYIQSNGVCNNGDGSYPNNAARMVVDAVKAADPTVNFSDYAVDGEVPNLFVVYAGTGAEWSGDPCLFWSHSWNLVDAGVAEADRTVDGVRINHYAVMPEVGGDLTNYRQGEVPRGPFPPTVGVYAHEYGHVLGLPDQYDYGYESDGTGEYSLMALGSWNRSSLDPMFSGDSPAHLDAWSKYMLGWVTPIEIKEGDPSTDYALWPVERYPEVYKMIVPDSGGKEYFLFENRQGIGFDQGLKRFDTHGLAIYHVDETVFDRNYDHPNEAENWKEFRSEGWRKAWTGETHYAISLVQADDRWDLEHGVYTPTSLAGDLYPGLLQKTEFGNYTAPNSSTYYFWGSNKQPKFGYSGVTVTNIQEQVIEEGDNDITAIIATFDLVPWKPVKK